MLRVPLTADQRTLTAELFEQHADAVMARLRREFPYADPDAMADAAGGAIMDAAVDSSDFDPDRGSFESYLFMHARGYLRTRLRGDRRRRDRERKKAALDVTRAAATAPPHADDDSPDPGLIRELMECLAHTDAEREALALWLDGVNAPDEVARRLGYGDTPDAVRRAKTLLARLRQRMHRERVRRSGTADADADGDDTELEDGP